MLFCLLTPSLALLFILCQHISNSWVACFYPVTPMHTFSSHTLTVNRLMVVDLKAFWGSSPSMAKLLCLKTVSLIQIMLWQLRKSSLNSFLFPPVFLLFFSFCLFITTLSYILSICMLNNALMHLLACLVVGMVLGWSWLSSSPSWHGGHIYLCVTMTAGVAAYQPMVKAGTVGSVLTSACHFGPDYSF